MTHPLMQYVHQHTFNMNDYVQQGIAEAIEDIKNKVSLTRSTHENVETNPQHLEYCDEMIHSLSSRQCEQFTQYTETTRYICLKRSLVPLCKSLNHLIAAYNMHHVYIQALMSELTHDVFVMLSSRIIEATLPMAHVTSAIRGIIQKYRKRCTMECVTCLKQDDYLTQLLDMVLTA